MLELAVYMSVLLNQPIKGPKRVETEPYFLLY